MPGNNENTNNIEANVNEIPQAEPANDDMEAENREPMSKHARQKALKLRQGARRIARKQKDKAARSQIRAEQADAKEAQNEAQEIQKEGMAEEKANVNDVVRDPVESGAEQPMEEAPQQPVEKENPFARNIVEQNQNPVNTHDAPVFERENEGFDIQRELNDSNVIVEADEDDEIEEEAAENKIEENRPAQNRPAQNAPSYKIEEIELGAGATENATTTHQVTIPDFYRRRDDRLNDQDVSDQVRSEMFAILRSAGSRDQRVPRMSFNQIIRDVTPTLKDSPFNGGRTADMQKVAAKEFEKAYFSISGTDLSPRDKIITAQKIADVMLKAYSPVAFVNGELDQYADNYVLNNNSAVLKEQLERFSDLSAEEIEQLVQNVQTEPVQTEPEQTAPAQTEPVQTEPEQTAPEQTEPEQTAPAQTEPEQTAPAQTEPEQTAPAQTAPARRNPFGWDDDDDEEIELEGTEAAARAAIQDLQNFARNLAEQLKQQEQQTQEQAPAQTEPAQTAPTQTEPAQTEPTQTEPAQTEPTQTEPAQTAPARRNPFGWDDDDDEEIELEGTEAAAQAAIQDLQNFARNFAAQLKAEAESNQPEEKESQKEEATPAQRPQFTEEEKRAQEQRLEEIVQRFRQDMQAIDDEETDILGGAADAIEALNQEKPQFNTRNDSAMFVNKLNSFNRIYGINVAADNLAFSVSEAWTLMKSGDPKKYADGQKMLKDSFKATLKQAFDVEKNASYRDHRIPEFADIIKSTNEMYRATMYAFTDMYHEKGNEKLFEATSFGGLDEKEMAELTKGESLWRMDQKSDEAWELQSQEAKSIAAAWEKEKNPYEKMINEMNAIVEGMQKGTIGAQETYSKLIAAEWLLMNNEKMLVEDPEDPLNPIPNWGNRYWKAIISAREAVGIPKHISMREMIQGDYAETAKAVENPKYNETQIRDYVTDPDIRAELDSMEMQREGFAIQSEAVVLTEPQVSQSGTTVKDTGKGTDKASTELETDDVRVQITIDSENEFEKVKHEPRIFSNMVVEKTNEIQLGGADRSSQK